MVNEPALEEMLSAFPLSLCVFLSPKELEFSQKVRYICQTDCDMYGKTWACPPAVGTVEECQRRCLGYDRCLLIGTVWEWDEPGKLDSALATRDGHEKCTNRVRDCLREQGISTYILSSQSCTICSRCAYPDGLPCRMPGRMHPCVESHGINLIPTLERLGIPFANDGRTVKWYSLLFFKA